MPWWGGGSDDSSSASAATKDFTSDDATSAGYGASENIMTSGIGSGGGMAELQQASMVLQQQMLVQQVIADLTDKSYEKCVTSKPTDGLSGSQVACIKATVNKWLDANEFITGRLAKKQQMQSQQGQF
mmetsp:Transcript_15580/g.25243  ORF Transcript_15580/g.25243 Transcript_15580/m.25243 type:complete len:128 (-) Transcript_15580:66-449(-)